MWTFKKMSPTKFIRCESSIKNHWPKDYLRTFNNEMKLIDLGIYLIHRLQVRLSAFGGLNMFVTWK